MADDSTTNSDLTTYNLEATRVSPKRTTVETGDASFEVGTDVNPVEYFLGAIGACINSTGSMVARDMDIDIQELQISIEGGVNYDRYAGRDSADRAGLQNIDVKLTIDADADDDMISQWLTAVKDRCPVTDNVENETDLSVTII